MFNVHIQVLDEWRHFKACATLHDAHEWKYYLRKFWPTRIYCAGGMVEI